MSGGPAHDAPDAGAPLLVLTEEELLLLEQAHLDGLTECPDVDARSPGARGTAHRQGGLAEARRSLTGRGLLSADGRLAEDSGPAHVLGLLLDVRLAADLLVVVERRMAGREDRPDCRLVHVMHLERVAVVEDVQADGLRGLHLVVGEEHSSHSHRAAEQAGLVEAALAPVLPADAVPGTGPVRCVDVARPDLLTTVLSGAVVLAEITVTTPDTRGDSPRGALLTVGPDGCFLARRGAAGTAWPGTTSEGVLRFEPVSREDVTRLLTGWMADAVRSTPIGQERIPYGA